MLYRQNARWCSEVGLGLEISAGQPTQLRRSGIKFRQPKCPAQRGSKAISAHLNTSTRIQRPVNRPNQHASPRTPSPRPQASTSTFALPLSIAWSAESRSPSPHSMASPTPPPTVSWRDSRSPPSPAWPTSPRPKSQPYQPSSRPHLQHLRRRPHHSLTRQWPKERLDRQDGPGARGVRSLGRISTWTT